MSAKEEYLVNLIQYTTGKQESTWKHASELELELELELEGKSKRLDNFYCKEFQLSTRIFFSYLETLIVHYVSEIVKKQIRIK